MMTTQSVGSITWILIMTIRSSIIYVVNDDIIVRT